VQNSEFETNIKLK